MDKVLHVIKCNDTAEQVSSVSQTFYNHLIIYITI